MTDYAALREAAEKAKVSRSVPAWDAFTDKTGPDDVLSLLDALAAARNDALEEAAKEAKRHMSDATFMGTGWVYHTEISSAIRALKVKP